MPIPEKIKIILDKAEDKLKSAQILFDNGQWSDSVSRAYYGVFHAIGAVLLTRELTFSSHAQTISAFNREFIKTNLFPKEFSRYITKIETDREVGDYRIIAFITEEVAKEDLSAAKRIYSICHQFLEQLYSRDKEGNIEKSSY